MSARLVRDTVSEMHRAESRWLDQARDRLTRAAGPSSKSGTPAPAGSERTKEDGR